MSQLYKENTQIGTQTSATETKNLQTQIDQLIIYQLRTDPNTKDKPSILSINNI